ncbi:MAG: hypothetical protein ACREUV_04190 [Burkholderiales bacterium]
MSAQPKALMLADAIDTATIYPSLLECRETAAELRRLHAVNAELQAALIEVISPWVHLPDSELTDDGSIRLARAALVNATKEPS